MYEWCTPASNAFFHQPCHLLSLLMGLFGKWATLKTEVRIMDDVQKEDYIDIDEGVFNALVDEATAKAIIFIGSDKVPFKHEGNDAAKIAKLEKEQDSLPKETL